MTMDQSNQKENKSGNQYGEWNSPSNFKNSAEPFKKNLNEFYEQEKEELTNVKNKIEQSTKSSPLNSLLIAGGIGLVLGMLLKR